MASARELLKEGERLHRERRFDEAIDVLREAVRLAEEDGGGSDSQILADCLSWLGLVLSIRYGRSKDPGALYTAKELHERAVSIERRLHGEEHACVAESLRLLGGVLDQLGLHLEAYEALKESVSIARSLSIRNRSTLDALARLSSVAFALHRYDEAASAGSEYLDLPAEDPLSDLEEMAGHMYVGRALLAADKPAEAVPHFERNVELARSRGRQRGIDEMDDWLVKARTAARMKPE